MQAAALFARLYGYLVDGLNWTGSGALLLFRLVMGWQWTQSGWGKLGNLDNVTMFFESLGIPAPGANAVLVGSTEFVGGMLILLGIGSRITMIPLIITMAVALLTAEFPSIVANFPQDTFATAEPGLFTVIWNLLTNDPGPLLSAPAFQFMVPALILLLAGPGRFSADALIGMWWKRRGTGTAA